MEESKQEEQKQPKHCPSLNKPCIREECVFYMKLQHQAPGIVGKVVGVCATVALVMSMTQLQQSMAAQQRRVSIPPNVFGQGSKLS